MFNRNKNKAPKQPPSLEQPRETKLYPGVESKHLNETVTDLDGLQRRFLDECTQRGLDPATATEAIRAAMESGAYPAVVSTRPRRDNVRVVSFMHGPVPEGLIEITENGTVSLNRTAADGSEWPTEPNPDDPSAFYVESYKVATHDRVPFYGDERDQANAQALRELNTRLSHMLSPSDEES